MVEFRNVLASWGSRVAAAFFVAVVGVVVLTSNANACSPGPDAFYPKSAKDASAVFFGEVVKAEIVAGSFAEIEGVKLVQVDFEVKESFKGKLPDRVSVLTHDAYMGGCGAPFLVGMPYFVVAMPFSNELTQEPATKNAVGYVMVFNVEDLPLYPPKLSGRLKELRAMR
jgi:hypothetical protein